MRSAFGDVRDRLLLHKTITDPSYAATERCSGSDV